MAMISVIMGVYNSKSIELLSKSIQSILDQTFKDFEFIICDDCSTKNDVISILDSYKNNDSRIKVIHNEKNQGLAYSLNHCLEFATGLYIARQDDDDISHKNRFEKQVEFLKGNKEYAIVGCNLNLFDENGIWGKRVHKETPTKEDFLKGSQFAHPATIIRKDIIDKIGRYNVCKMTRRTEDYELYMRLYSYGYIGYNMQDVLYDYYESMITYRNQKLKYRLDEIKVRYVGFKALSLMPIGLFYCLKPLVSGLMPNFIRKLLKKNKYSKEL